MRRLLALVLLLVFGSAEAAPLLASMASPVARLPICCRQGAVHHCMDQMMQPQSAEAAARAVCPSLPQYRASLSGGSQYSPVPSRFAGDADPRHKQVHQREYCTQSRRLEAQQSRGPPQA